MAEFPQSREEAILQATINGEEYTGYPESRIEALLLELKAVIEGGGGGGGTTNYNLLENKPQIGGVTLTGNKSASDLSLASTSRLADAENMVCAEFFDASKAYTKDTYVIYNDGLYKFKSAHTAGAAWDATIVDEVDLLTVIQEATNTTIAPPVLNKESVVSENDVNSLSAIFTAQQTSAYMLILSICNSESFPTLTSCTVSVNSEAKTVSDYYVSEGYGIASKYVLLNLEAGDSIAASIASSVDVFGTSASIMLVRLSNSINGLTLKDAEFSNSYVDPTLNFNAEKDAVYLLWFFNRSDGVGTFKTLKKNNANITTNKIVCSSGSGWQISHGMCMVYAKALDTFTVAIQFNGYFDAVGVFEVLMDTGESYNDLKDKPQIGGVTLSGNKSLSDLGIPTALASLTDDATHRTVTDTEKSTWNTTGEAIEAEKTATGNPITVTDALPYNAVSLSAEIEASQNLHGYDHPWSGGAGKNKAPFDLNAIKAANTSGTWSGNAYTYRGVTYTFNDDGSFYADGTATANAALAYIPQTENWLSGTYTMSVGYNSPNDFWAFLYDFTAAADVASLNNPTFTISGTNQIGFRMYVQSGKTANHILIKPMIRISTESDTWEPYANICPISGRTAVVLNDHGKNVLPNNIVDGTVDGITYTKQSDGSVKINGTSTGRANRPVAEYHLQNGTWIVSKGQANALFGLNVEAYNDNTWVKVLAQSFSTDEVQFTVDNNGYNKIRVSITTESGRTANNLIYYPMIRSASDSDPTYAPFTGNTDFTIQLGQTVYGCTLNVTTGVLTVKNKTVKGNTITFIDNTVTEGQRFRSQDTISDAKTNQITSTSLKCSKFDTNTASLSFANFDGICIHTNGYLYVRSLTTADLTAFNALIADADICYELATPITIQLTPTQLEMLKGYNRLSSDGGGAITLTYKANKADSVQAEVDVLETTKADNADVVDYIENGNTASRAYSANQFMLWKGDLYKVTTSIASGATITAGTNVSKTSIGAVLTALLNA